MTKDDLLWHGFIITQVLDCVADPTKNRIVAELSDDISPVFPYLNATMSQLMYNPGAQTVTVKRGERIITFYPREATMAKVNGARDAEAQLVWFQNLCNDTWRRRDEIVPCYERRKLLGPLDVYWLLPRLNCHDCGKPTCMAFAFGLLLDDLRLSECPHLLEDDFAEGAVRLAEMLSLQG
jgi:ArsR family metal-binding transcriptional regulator